MEERNSRKPFNKRAFIAVAMTMSLLILPVSGYMNHQLQFESLTVERHCWMAVHNMAGTLFVIFSIIHFFLNQRALQQYIVRQKDYLFSKEFLAAVLIIGGFIVLFASHAFHVR
jgi:hypothetical protein